MILGVDTYDHLNDLAGVKHSTAAIRELITSPDVGGFDEFRALPADVTSSDVEEALTDVAELVVERLLVFYSGHGHYHSRHPSEFMLATKASRLDRPGRSISFKTIEDIVGTAKARHKIVIVDCCYSGNALAGHPAPMSADPDADSGAALNEESGSITISSLKAAGTCVLTSATAREQSLCRPDGSAFADELARLLRDGLGAEDLEYLSMGTVFDALRTRIDGQEVGGFAVPKPRMSTLDDGHGIVLARNQAHSAPRAAMMSDKASSTLCTVTTPTQHFTGRASELARLERLCSRPGAVGVVYGRGGQGKSELLRMVSDRVADRFPGGRLEIDLRGWSDGEDPRDPAQVIIDQLHLLGYTGRIPDGHDAQRDLWRRHLSEHPILLLLDNARHADQVRPLLPPAGSPSVALVASRTRLDGLPTIRFALDRLSTAECVDAWRKMNVSTDEDRLGEIAEIVQGSPLAVSYLQVPLELGADPEGVVSELRCGFDAFPDLDDAMRTAFNMAYEALAADLQELIHYCAWHPGPNYGADSISAMAERTETETDIALTRIEQLLIPRGGGRYSFHDHSLGYARAAAAAHADPSIARASRYRLYAHLLDGVVRAQRETSAEIDSAGEVSGVDWIDRHLRELRAAAIGALNDGWGEGSRLLGEVTWVHRVRGRYEEAAQLYNEALTICRDVGSRRGRADAAKGLGGVRRMQGRYDDAIRNYNDALAIYGEIGSRLGLADATLGVAEVNRLQGRYEDSARIYEDALSIYRSIGDRAGQADATKGLAEIQLAQGHYDDALRAYSAALTMYSEIDSHLGQADATLGLAEATRLQNRYEDATRNFRAALTIYRAVGDRTGQAHATWGLAEVSYALGDEDEAGRGFDVARDIYAELGITSLSGLGETRSSFRQTPPDTRSVGR